MSIHHETAQPAVVTTAVTVSDPIPLVSPAGPITALAGTSTGLVTVASFTDPGGPEPNPSDPDPNISHHYTADIDWGDGSGLQLNSGTITGPNAAGVYSVTGSHTYASAGPYSVQVIVHHELVTATAVSTPATVLGIGTASVVNGVLWVVGTNANDRIEVEPWTKLGGHSPGKPGQIEVEGAPFLPGKYHDMQFDSAGITRIEVLCGNGNDFCQIEGNLRIPAIVDGGAGNDTLIGGIAGAVLLGGSGNDTLIADSGYNILIGGTGSDKLYNRSRQGSIMIGGSTDYDYNVSGLPNDVALLTLLSEWSSGGKLRRPDSLSPGGQRLERPAAAQCHDRPRGSWGERPVLPTRFGFELVFRPHHWRHDALRHYLWQEIQRGHLCPRLLIPHADKCSYSRDQQSPAPSGMGNAGSNNGRAFCDR